MSATRLDATHRFDALAVRLAAAARRIAEARGREIALAGDGGELRWRSATNLWPLFAKD